MSNRRVIALRSDKTVFFITRAWALRLVDCGAARWVGSANRKVKMLDVSEVVVSDAGARSGIWDEILLHPLRGPDGRSVRHRVPFAGRAAA